MTNSRCPTVAIVDDEPQLLALFSEALADGYRVREVDSGESVLEVMDDDVDVLLLDRKLPRLSGDEVLLQLREAGYDIPVAMLTGIRPDFDVLEMGFDDYLLKPVSVADLKEVTETLLRRREYDEAIREYFALASKMAALRSSKHRDDLENNERFTRAAERLEELQRRAERSLDTVIDAGEFEDLVRESISTERLFEDGDDEDDSELGFD